MVSKDGEIYEITSTTSGLAKELQTIPVLQALGDIYTRTKDSNGLLKRALGLVETSCTGVADRVYVGTKLGSTLDSMAVNGLTKLKETCPIVMKPSDELIQLGQDKTSKMVRQTSRRVMKTYPGQKFASGLNWAIDVSERLLYRLRPRSRSPAKLYRNNNSPTKDRNREPAYATEDSGAYDTSEGKKGDKPALPDIKIVHMKTPSDQPKGLLVKAYDVGVILPIRTLVAILKWVRLHLAIPSKRRKSERQKMTPDKQAEIRSRKKVSPRKKVAPSFLETIKHAACSYIGYKGWSSRRIKLDSATGSETVSPGRDDGEKKRKHDEILTDDGSESETDIATFEIDDYNSEDDPDYEPSEDSDVSEDISDGETESDIEAEIIDLAKECESPLVQLKDKRRKDKKPDEKTDSPKANDVTTKKPDTDVKKTEKTDTTPIYAVKKPEQKNQSQTNQAMNDLPQNDQAKKEQTQKDMAKKDQVQKDQPKKDPVQKDQPKKDLAQKDQPKKDLAQKDQPKKDLVQKDQQKKDPLPKDQTKKDPPQKDQIKKSPAPNEQSKKSPAPNDQSKKCPAPAPNDQTKKSAQSPPLSLKPEWKTFRETEK